MKEDGKLTLAERAQAIIDNSSLYSKYEVLKLMKDWKKDYHKNLLSNVKTQYKTKI
jgi:hypothetical protein